MNRRFTVVRDDPQKCWRIFDTSVNKFTPYKHERQVQADAEAAELNEMDAKGDVTITAGAVGKLYPKKAAGALTGRLNDPVPAGETTKKVAGEYSQTEGQPWTRGPDGISGYPAKHPMAATEGPHLDKRHQCVLDALAGKVVCSACGKAYHGNSGSLAVGPAAAPVHSIKVTRYIGFDTAKLTVDIDCTDCGHGGLYEFAGNPLIDAGIVAPLSDIPF